ncbi:Ran-binding protein 9 [Hypsibius exemplaris]|uniref:Ran-binding protein 9 n=1 Tax=Hypsibius exemplaris TaxID=2072580 RepID=A0A1W0W8E8_HYPEX|nr:Ran-binding protein 9 [Hypsibius exemplaris]
MEKKLVELYPWVNQAETPIPMCWNPKDKFSYITLTQNDTKILYKGPGKSQKDAAAVRTKHPIPVSCGLFYFEVKVISKGKEGYIGVGLSQPDVNLNRLPGWDKGSFGYHGDDGHTFWSSGTGRSYGPTFGTGDVIGCGLDLVNNKCFYTKNGMDLGVAFTDLTHPSLYPCVGLQSTGEVVETNFGQEPFMFDISSIKKELEVDARNVIAKYQAKLSRGEWEQTLQKIVLDYLVHNGFHAAAESFSKSYRNTTEGNGGVHVRQFIEMVGGRDSGVAGQPEGKSHLRPSRTPSPRDLNRNGSTKHTNGILKEEPARPNGLALNFDSEMETEVVLEDHSGDCVMEVDMPVGSDAGTHTNGLAVAHNGGDVTQSMDFDDDDDEENKVVFGGNPELLRRTLDFGKHLNEFAAKEAFSLMAYSDPWRSPLAHLLDPLQREPVCASLNSALLGDERQTSHPALKVLISHSKRLFPLQAKRGSGVIAFRNIFEVLRSLNIPDSERMVSSCSGKTSDSESSSC